MRHFGHDLLQKDCEHIVPRGNIATFLQKDEIRFALGHTGDRRLAEASPHDTMWGIGLSARDSRASSPDSWCGQNLLGQALENAREILHRDIPAPLSYPTPEPLVHWDAAGGTVFEVDPITHLRLDTTPFPVIAQTAVLSAFTELVPDDHAPEVLLAQEQRAVAQFLPE